MPSISRREFLAASAAAALACPAPAADPKKLVLIAGIPSHPPGHTSSMPASSSWPGA